VTDVKSSFVADLTAKGIPAHEARWLVDEFIIGDDVDAATALNAAVARRLEGEPLQYVIGHWPFRYLDLDVDERVLIPRPETEELVGVALEELATLGISTPSMLDLGCGSGAIGLALLDELKKRGVQGSLIAVDASLDALQVAKRNALKHRLLAASFVHSSWFDALDPSLQGHIDLIVSNPPYISDVEFENVEDVLLFEPRMAQTAPDAEGIGGFADIATIVSEAPAWLTPHGVLIVEHGNTQGDAAVACALRAGFSSAHTVSDMAGHPRMLVAKK
jgi:release factor glutamine methyltransferase